ncbi:MULTISPECIES: imelysin family protein [Rhizobium]|uniref:Iron-regulated protein n=1 Tax=Rhizobium favelukesii TaxID=348824 RepID=W6RP26_9HYPH|nr:MULTISPECIES: imelysin family protein [Rhizobium]MCA0804197.1 imelysin family protein [Rhizobium sp. T1473]MCS0462504.1 imelysin family protein [Rhizobium favelukesii]UFS82261.1 imelysin family protein [Rhizobium sp. T136]CDM56056.1 putative iron-regulated protein [Rhizobium favelukesii]
MKLNKNFCAAVALAVAPTALLAIPAYAAPDAAAVVKHYAEVAHAKYEDSLATAKAIDAAIDAMLKNPTDETLKAARAAWIKARVPYQQTEVYRFGNPIVDDWEGKVNAWPLDEGLIDYVDASYGTESDENSLYVANVIANKTIKIDGKDVDASKLTPEFLSGTLAEAGGVEANVATGYHAIEFLLWGQDLTGTGPGAGNRPATDYDLKNCTHGNCDRRAEYLKSASTLLVSDLQEMTNNWAPDGEATKHVEVDPKAGLVAILTGMGSLSYGELAGERMKLGLLLHDPEEEHDCFSDNTYNSHLNDAIGIAAAYTGDYTRVDGTKMAGPSLHDLVAAKDKKVDKEMQAKLKKTLDAMQVMAKRGQNVEKYDQMIGEGNKKGNAVVQAAIDGLVDQTKSVQRVIAALDLGTVKLEGSDSLDNPGAVFQ